jgi:hypothetical protein
LLMESGSEVPESELNDRKNMLNVHRSSNTHC